MLFLLAPRKYAIKNRLHRLKPGDGVKTAFLGLLGLGFWAFMFGMSFRVLTYFRTIEGLESADGTLHPVQRAFVDAGAIQCGYCTPGMVMRALAFLEKSPDPTDEEIARSIEGNLCRCTGYVKIHEAIRAAAAAMAAVPACACVFSFVCRFLANRLHCFCVYFWGSWCLLFLLHR